MELAERIEEKRPSVVKSETIESNWTVNSKFLQRGNNIRLFIAVIIVGMFLILAGGLLIAFKNLMGHSGEVSVDTTEATHGKRPTHVSDRNVISNSQKTWFIVVFTLIGVGATLFAIGSVVVVTSYVRYRLSMGEERFPILDKNSETNPEEFDPSSTKNVYSKSRRPKKRTASWMKNTTRSLSREGFRFAAHRHPSINPVSIDGSRFFFRKLSEHSSSSSSDEKVEEMNSSTTVGDFLRKILRWNARSESQDKLEVRKDRSESQDDSLLHEGDFRFLSARNSEDFTDHDCWNKHAGGESESTSTHSGLYNLEQE